MLGFLIAALAGFLTPQIEGPVAGPVIEALEKQFTVAPNEKRLIAFMVALVGAAVVATLLDSGTVFGIVLGAVLGYFAPRIFAVLKRVIEARSD